MDHSPKTPENIDESSENHDGDRRAFLKEGMKRAALLPYVAPVIETIYLSDAHASDDDDDGGSRGNNNSGSPSIIGNGTPPIPPPRIRSVSPKEGLFGRRNVDYNQRR